MPDDMNPTGAGSTPPQKPTASTDSGQPPATGDQRAPLPTASVEPEAQATASMTNPLSDASIKPAAPAGGEKAPAGGRSANLGGDGAPDLLPPPSSYEMPDEYADTWLTSARRWVEEHPALAVAAAAGVGLVIGRIVVGMSSSEPEPTLVGKVEQRARAMRKELRKETKDLLKDARSALKDVRVADSAEAMQAKLRQAASALAAATEHAGGRAGDAVEEGVERGRDLADSLSDAVRSAVSGVVTKAVDEWTARRK
jgi:ElaB/YqjD/DUF883 family membrane-anchored ribosome-binding protein